MLISGASNSEKRNTPGIGISYLGEREACGCRLRMLVRVKVRLSQTLFVCQGRCAAGPSGKQVVIFVHLTVLFGVAGRLPCMVFQLLQIYKICVALYEQNFHFHLVKCE